MMSTTKLEKRERERNDEYDKVRKKREREK